MNENKRIQLWKWAVILLLLCNLGLVVMIWLRPGSPKGPGRETPRDFVIRSLKFSDEQVKQYDLLIRDHQEAMHRLRHEAMEYRQVLFTNLGKEGKNDINTDSLSQLIANNQKQIEMVTYQHFKQVRILCTDAQKTAFDRIIGDVIKKMNGPGHGPHPPPPGPHPPDDQGHNRNPPPVEEDGPPPPPDGR